MAKKYEKHGDAAGRRHTKEYKAWVSMRRRCENELHPSFPAYGGRGIKICDQWRLSYTAFLEDMGRSPPGSSIDRINNDGDYAPGNCRWSDKKTQQVNRRNSIWITVNGSKMPLHDAAEAAGLSHITVYARLKAGWPEERLLEPATKRKKHRDRPATPNPPLTPTAHANETPAEIRESAQALLPGMALTDKTRRLIRNAFGLDVEPKRNGPRKERFAYKNMIDRCYNASNASWEDYGGRGIIVCDRWLASYAAFLEDVGVAPEGTSLERVDVNKGYGPDNCRWGTPLEQARNRTNTPFVTYKGKRMPLSAAAAEAGMKYITVHMRWRRGWPEDRLFEPATHRRSQNEWVRPSETPRRPLTGKPRKP